MSFDLDPNEVHTKDDYVTSGFLVIGNKCYWETLPYGENPTNKGSDDKVNSIPEKFEDTEAVVIECGVTGEGITNGAGSNMIGHYWIYEYEYRLPGTSETKKHRDKIQFVASGYSPWLSKYPRGFRFPVRYSKVDPPHHIRLHEFD